MFIVNCSIKHALVQRGGGSLNGHYSEGAASCGKVSTLPRQLDKGHIRRLGTIHSTGLQAKFRLS